MALNGLSQVNIELSSRCYKSCSFCGHQDPKINKKLEYGDIDRVLLLSIRDQVPDGIVIQMHRDGEPLVYPYLDDALFLFRNHITSIVTNGKKLVEKAEQIIDHCDTVTVSVFRGDPDGASQLDILSEFLKLKGDFRPQVMVKIVGDLEADRLKQYHALNVRIITRPLHVPEGSFHYVRRSPPVPETGICMDFLHHPSIDWQGNVYVCNRLDGEDQGLLGNLRVQSLSDIWNGPKRMEWLAAHRMGRRDLASSLCAKCEYWGVPTG